MGVESDEARAAVAVAIGRSGGSRLRLAPHSAGNSTIQSGSPEPRNAARGAVETGHGGPQPASGSLYWKIPWRRAFRSLRETARVPACGSKPAYPERLIGRTAASFPAQASSRSRRRRSPTGSAIAADEQRSSAAPSEACCFGSRWLRGNFIARVAIQIGADRETTYGLVRMRGNRNIPRHADACRAGCRYAGDWRQIG